MKQFDVEIKKAPMAGDPLPAGGYIAEIKKAEVVSYSWGDVLQISFDVSEGKYKDHFATDYRNNTYDNKKWKGVFRLVCPDPENQYYESQKRTFGDALYCLQESNVGYKWDWDEAKLKGKKVGVLFREREWEYDGKTGMTTECCRLLCIEDVKEEKFKIPKPKMLNNKSTSSNSKPAVADDFEEVSDDDLPF